MMSAAGELFIGLDVGTSGVKGALCTRDGEVLTRTREPITLSRPNPGWAEHDPEEWWDAVGRIVRRLGGETGTRDRVAAVGISGVCPVLVPMDAAGSALRPAIMYSIDERAKTQVERLRSAFDAADIHRRSGQGLGSQNLLAKAMWLRENEPGVWSSTRTLLGSTGYLVHRLTGAMTVDHFSAADGGLGYLLEARDWDVEAFRVADIDPSLMPALHWPAERAGVVHAQAAAQIGLAEGTPVIVGTGDALADLVATGARRTGEGALLYGTSMSTMVLAATPSGSDAVVNVPGWQPEQLVRSVILPTGIGLFEWWARWMGAPWHDDSLADVNAALARSAPGAQGLTHLPYLAGGRTHLPDGALLGMRAAHSEDDRTRAIAEGLAHALRAQLGDERMPHHIRAIGAGSSIPELVQLITDVCGFRQTVLSGDTDAAVGSARLALEGVHPAAEPWGAPTAESFDPSPARRAIHDAGQRRFDAAARALSSLAVPAGTASEEGRTDA